MGAWQSSNKGAKIATGEYIYFVQQMIEYVQVF